MVGRGHAKEEYYPIGALRQLKRPDRAQRRAYAPASIGMEYSTRSVAR